MEWSVTRRGMIQAGAVVGGALTALSSASATGPLRHRNRGPDGWVKGRFTGAQAVAEALRAEGCGCVYGIPGAQENELWDEFKARQVPYLLVAHEYSAACMADGYARSTGQPGVVCVVPGPGLTNALTGLGEALLDSSPVVAIIGDVANGSKFRPFQVHSLSQVDLLKPVCKCIYPVSDVRQIAQAIRLAFQAARSGEPGPAAVVIPFNLFIDVADYNCGPVADAALPWDEERFEKSVALLADRSRRVGIYAGLGCMDSGESLLAVAEMLQAPVATSVSGKGVIPESHPLAVGWGYGPHGSRVAEVAFNRQALIARNSGVDTLLAIGVKFSEVSTGFYGNPKPPCVIHVDINPDNLGQILSTDVSVPADAGDFLQRLLSYREKLTRPHDGDLRTRIEKTKREEAALRASVPARSCGIDPLAVVAGLRRALPENGLLFTDVTATEHLAAEHFTVYHPRTYFNPVDNQAMGWALPAAIGAQRVHGNRCVAALVGDGGFLMSMQELATAAREHLPVKVLVLDDQAYHYMQALQQPAFKRTTATHLPKLDYRALAAGFGVGYQEATTCRQLDTALQTAFGEAGPVLIRIVTDYTDRPIRWIEAARKRFADELSPAQKARFLARIGARSISGAGKSSD